MSNLELDKTYKGPIAWMTQNHVAANLLMLILLIGGFVSVLRMKQEVFPEFSLDIVNVSVLRVQMDQLSIEPNVGVRASKTQKR